MAAVILAPQERFNSHFPDQPRGCVVIRLADISHSNRNSPYHPAGVPNRMLLVDGW